MTTSTLSRLRAHRRLRGAPAEELIGGPIRGELLGAERLAERARLLARDQELAPVRRRRRPARLLARLAETRSILDAAHERLSDAVEHEVDVGPAGEWLLDNFHVVQEHVREVRESLPGGYYRELPELARGTLAGYPRVYELATTLIGHSEARVDLENCEMFVAAFQQVSTLSIGELWSIPAMLRLGLIESVRRMALRTVQRLDEVQLADRWAARLLGEDGAGSIGARDALRAFVESPPPLTAIFVTRLLQQLRLSRDSFAPLLWLEQWIADEGPSSEEAGARSAQRLALTQVMTANSITSLRTIARMDWRIFVERQSEMEQVLRSEPTGMYARMTFQTRDHYRHVVERIAKRTDRGEADVARMAVALATRGGDGTGDPDATRRAHVGYYLIDAGREELERAAGYRPAIRERAHRAVLRHPNTVFVGGIVAGTAAALALTVRLAADGPPVALLPLLLLALVPASDVGVTIVNQLVSAFLPPRVLPKLELLDGAGVPPELRTAVVIPTLFPSVDAVREALENLEVQFLANREAHLHFAVLSDFTDAATETMPGDDKIVAAAVEGVRALNARYAGGAQDAFYLFHRARQWNATQGVWMGWERKRGKLAQFNRLLRSSADDGAALGAFATIVGNVELLRSTRYVVTLDSDTVLPPDAAPLLIGAIAHPLNRAVYDDASGRVVRGYGILQPRVGVSLPSAHKSHFAAIHSGHPGVDPYTTAVSDVYQDLFGEGSFTGKGIYDVDAFERATHGRFPENTLLSHDLIEGSYARAGLSTDIEVFDDYPTRYLTYTRRKHRWIRGDWQLLKWLTPWVPGPDGTERNRLSLLSRWKLLDNMRRSLVEIAQLLFLVAGWIALPGSPLRWTAIGLGFIAAPWLLSLTLAVLRPPVDKSFRAYYAAVGRDAVTSLQQFALAVVFLPHQAWVSADAIVRTLGRMYVTHRNLLEWQTASQTERSTGGAARDVWRTMWPAVAIAVVALVAAVGTWAVGARDGSVALAVAVLPLVGAWIASPAIAHALSAPWLRREHRLSADEQSRALHYALLHWRFFDRFVTEETNWLAPDNYQDDPTPVVAMRTSPTNIGLQLLSTVSAYDLGFLTADELAHRLELALRSMERMRRFRGHFYNWYDLRDLHVLEPAYISTVDSGNLAGHLIALRQACLAIADDRVIGARVWRALGAALDLAFEHTDRIGAYGGAETPDSFERVAAAARELGGARDVVRSAERDRRPSNPLARMEVVGNAVSRAFTALRGADIDRDMAAPAIEWVSWCAALTEQHRSRLHALGVAEVVANVATNDKGGMPTLRQLAADSTAASELVARFETIAHRAFEYAMEMDFRFLYDERRKLFSIGYHQASHSLDSSFYDLLASEARLASFVAIAKNDVPVEHWFRLGRTLTHADGETALVSWSGSMFEYLMPLLVMESFPFTVLDQTYRGAVRRQIAYGAERDAPWGVSESAYNLRDRHYTYQYRAFGVPNLALKRGLGRDLVIAPYASALAVMVAPEAALANLAKLSGKGALGPFGFRDALDYTRPAPGARFAVVHAYMAHHIGMGFVALTNALTESGWQRRFHSDPMVRAAELLLHERIPRRLVLQDVQEARPDDALPDPELERPAVREIENPDTPQPVVALLGHLPYTVMATACGAGYSRYENLAVTRWRSDGTADNTGQFCYIRDLTAGRGWSAGHQPTGIRADWYRALLATDRLTIHRADGPVETRLEIAVVPGDAAEVRRVTLTNNSAEQREIEVTSYGEIVLTTPDADRAHPAFANLFVETEWHEWCTAITATRRPRAAHERSLWCVHVVDTGAERVGPVTCETDRARFVGRGRTTRNPVAMDHEGPLSMTTGSVLDPVFALRTRLSLAPGQSASVAFTTLVATTREGAFELADRYHLQHTAQRALDLAWTATQVELRELGITPSDAAIFQDLAGHLFYSTPTLRAPEAVVLQNEGTQQTLWAAGVSGDWPILLATIDSVDGVATLRQLLSAHHYWRRRGMMVDLVILNTRPPSYLQDLQDRITSTIVASSESGVIDRPGGIFIRRRDVIADAELLMLRATARVHIDCDGRPVARILEVMRRGNGDAPASSVAVVPAAAPVAIAATDRAAVQSNPPPREPLQFDNGLGGLAADGDYVITVRGDELPPAPWANVVATDRGGFLVSERGSGVTWMESAYFYRLTPWHNDPVSDPASDVLYLRDEESGAVWSATPAPAGGDSTYTVRHGAGSSSFSHLRGGIGTELRLGIPEAHAAKLSLLTLTNHGATPRRLSLTAYAEWTLGAQREHTQHQVRTWYDDARSAVLARNSFDPLFAQAVSFCALSEPVASFTSDRREFLGRNGAVSAPAGMRLPVLSGTTGARLDPCAALRCTLELAPGETKRVVVVLGAAKTLGEAGEAIDALRDVGAAAAAMERTVDSWRQRLSTVTVRTPEPSFDAMLNRWSLYQALACRMWARIALYQSSGAYGFRDQLQDSMAFVYAEPALARAHIVRAAGRQFVEGDVQHWWHPHSGRGVRTKFSDDLAWLPYVADHYIRVSGDVTVLDEKAPYLTMRQLEPHEHEVYDLPQLSGEEGSVYEHCIRALRRACTTGQHGLPLMGIGDWNDGMNRVGVEGRGVSVWLAWFLTTTLRAFAPYADARGDGETAAWMRRQADDYVAAIEREAWDGEWYRRAYFDDGTPLGSRDSDECRIDAIAQSWSVISGAGLAERQAQAMRSFEQHLVREDARLLMLLTPAFDRTPNDPGYIKGYLPGVRENGAQYTHAALWSVLATALRGDGDRAFELFQMINPLTHAMTPEDVASYKVEPYVVAADVYTAAGHLGRGGWTWYTGSASWMYRVALEAILGFTLRGSRLTLAPCIPASWPEFSVEYRFGTATYAITVRNPHGVERGASRVVVDGVPAADGWIALADDGRRHDVIITVERDGAK